MGSHMSARELLAELRGRGVEAGGGRRPAAKLAKEAINTSLLD